MKKNFSGPLSTLGISLFFFSLFLELYNQPSIGPHLFTHTPIPTQSHTPTHPQDHAHTHISWCTEVHSHIVTKIIKTSKVAFSLGATLYHTHMHITTHTHTYMYIQVGLA